MQYALYPVHTLKVFVILPILGESAGVFGYGSYGRFFEKKLRKKLYTCGLTMPQRLALHNLERGAPNGGVFYVRQRVCIPRSRQPGPLPRQPRICYRFSFTFLTEFKLKLEW